MSEQESVKDRATRKTREILEAMRDGTRQELDEARLERTFSKTTDATIYVGAGAIGTEILGWATESGSTLMIAGALGRVFNGLLVVDVVLGIYLVAKRVGRKRARRKAKEAPAPA